METVRKKICLEESRNRKEGILPFIPFDSTFTGVFTEVDEENSNWGNFTADILGFTFSGMVMSSASTIHDTEWEWKGTDGERIRSREMIRRYNAILDILRNGTFVERVDNRLCSEGEDPSETKDPNDGYLYRVKKVDSAEQYSFLRGCRPLDAFFFERIDDKTYRQVNVTIEDGEVYKAEGDDRFKIEDKAKQFSGQCGILITDAETYSQYGGQDFINEVDKVFLKAEFFEDKDSLAVPYLEVPIALVSTMAEVGEMTPYDDEAEYKPTVNTKLKPQWSSFSGVEVESKLYNVRSSKYEMSDEGTLPGIFVSGGFFTFKGEGSWEETDGSQWTCGDGQSTLESNEYQTTPLFSTGEALAESLGWTKANFRVLYNNTEETPMVIPYEVNIAHNISSGEGFYVADYIKEINYYDSEGVKTESPKEAAEIEFIYVIQGQCGGIEDGKVILPSEKSGLIYHERYNFEYAKAITATFDGVESTVYCNNIDFEGAAVDVYSSDFNLTKKGNIANLLSGFTGDIWQDGITFDESGYTINTPIFKEEGKMGALFGVKTDLDDIEIDRGNAAAFERHFILSECNTYDDLENYRNNFFNID